MNISNISLYSTSSFNLNDVILWFGFLLLFTCTFFGREGFRRLKKRSIEDWLLDLSGLFMQGIAIHWLSLILVVTVLRLLLPDWSGVLEINALATFLISFVIVDYGYYWNHRLLHAKRFWKIHQVHHTALQMDVLVTSRNTLWTSIFILYVWVNGLMLFLLVNPFAYFFGVSLTAVLDLWRHSTLQPKGKLQRILGSILVLPTDHAWHHSRDTYGVNFGANINLWDRLHGTWLRHEVGPSHLGVKTHMGLLHKLCWPFK